jgi:hypothetical protein
MENKNLGESCMAAAWESLHGAALEIASADSVKQRVTNAFSKHLEDMDVGSLPVELRPRYLDLVTRLTRVPPLRGETAVAATVRKMSNEEAAECAQQIVELLAEAATVRAPITVRTRPMLSVYSADG